MRIFAKLYMYALNAYLDAQICEELVMYVKSQGKSYATKNTIAQQRAEKLVKTDKNNFKKDPSFVIGLAYTEYYLNGLADILYANIFWWFIISTQRSRLKKTYNDSILRFRSQLTTQFQYQEFVNRPFISLWYWPFVVNNPWIWVGKFANERCNYSSKLDKDALRRASIAVQHQNIQNNHTIAQALTNNEKSIDPKVKEVRKVAKLLENSDIFVSEAAATQKAAAKWDKIFIWLISR